MANWKCPTCLADLGSAITLKQHYDKYPHHMGEKAKQRRKYAKLRKRAATFLQPNATVRVVEASPKPKYSNIAVEEPFEKKAVMPSSNGNALRYCPCCGVNIERISAAVEMAGE